MVSDKPHREFSREWHHIDQCRDCLAQIVVHSSRRFGLCAKCTEVRFRYKRIRVNPVDKPKPSVENCSRGV